MSKTIQKDGEPIYLTPTLKGVWENGDFIVKDEKDKYDHKELDPTNLDHKITIYEREVEEWFLKPAQEILDNNSFDNALIVIMICMAYFEGVEQYKVGKPSINNSKKYFKNSVMRLYPHDHFTDAQLDALYKGTRCGLFHDGMVKDGVVFNNDHRKFPKAIEFSRETIDFGSKSVNKIKINPKLLLEDIKKDFKSYIKKLRDKSTDEPESLRQKFNIRFNILPFELPL